jgi:hypothetical protein
MSNSSYRSDDLWFVSVLAYLFGEDSLTRIELDQRGKAMFYMSVPELDAIEYRREFDGKILAISDLMTYSRTYAWIAKRIRDMKRTGQTSYCSPSWIAGRGN